MTLRQQLKLPRYGLFYFESDQTVSVVPMSKVKKVLEGDHRTIGSVVELHYGSLLLKAEIIGVDDNPSNLDQVLIDFTTDPQNAHRFTFSDDQQPLVQENKCKGKTKNCEPAQATQNKKKGKSCSGQKKEPKEKKKKEKEQATVVVRINPAASTVASTGNLTDGSSSFKSQNTCTPPQPDSLPLDPTCKSDTPSSPVPSSGDSLPAFSPSSRMPQAHTPKQSDVRPAATPLITSSWDRLVSQQSHSPAISIQSSESTLRQPSSLPRRLRYTATSTSLYSDWSSATASPVQFSPRDSLFRQARSTRYYSTPTSKRSTQSPFFKTPHSRTASPEWHSNSMLGGSPYSRSQMSFQKEDDVAEIRQMLRRLERKVDQLLETSSSKPKSFMLAARQPRETEIFIPSNLMEAEDDELLPENQDGSVKTDSLLAIRARASSSMNFAVRLLREFFLPGELKGKNVSGLRGKEQLDPARIQKIKNFVYEFYPTPPSERDYVWRECRKAIDSYLRKTFRSN